MKWRINGSKEIAEKREIGNDRDEQLSETVFG